MPNNNTDSQNKELNTDNKIDDFSLQGYPYSILTSDYGFPAFENTTILPNHNEPAEYNTSQDNELSHLQHLIDEVFSSRKDQVKNCSQVEQPITTSKTTDGNQDLITIYQNISGCTHPQSVFPNNNNHQQQSSLNSLVNDTSSNIYGDHNHLSNHHNTYSNNIMHIGQQANQDIKPLTEYQIQLAKFILFYRQFKIVTTHYSENFGIIDNILNSLKTGYEKLKKEHEEFKQKYQQLENNHTQLKDQFILTAKLLNIKSDQLEEKYKKLNDNFKNDGQPRKKRKFEADE